MSRIIRLFSLCLLLLPAVPAASFDYSWGGRVTLNGEAPELQGTVLAVSTTDSLGLWFKGRWNDLFHLQADAALVYEADFRYGVAFDSQELGYFGREDSFYPALREFYLYGRFDRFYYQAGRQLLEDAAGLVVSHPGDGLLLGARLGGGAWELQGVYTGFVQKRASTLGLTVNDLSGDHPGSFGAPRLLGKLSWSHPGLLQQSLTLNLIAQRDLHSKSEQLAGSELLHSQYLEAVLQGFLLPSLSYRLSAAGQTGSYGDASLAAGVARLETTFRSARGGSALGIDLLSSSGDSWKRGDYYGSSPEDLPDTLHQYQPISSVSGRGYVHVFELGNITSLGAFWALNPQGAFSTELRATTFLRTAAGPVSSSLVLNDGEKDRFLGQEGVLSFLLRPASDLSFGFKAGVLYRGDVLTVAEDLEKYLPVLARAGLDVSLSF